MKLYRFSPIETEGALRDAIAHIDTAGHELCTRIMGRSLSMTGSLAVFAHYEDEYKTLKEIQQKWARDPAAIHEKYRELRDPIKSRAAGARYTRLYIRAPDPYRVHIGDFDVCLPSNEYTTLKNKIESGQGPRGARIFPRPDLDMIELFDPDVDVLVYIVPEKDQT